MPIVAVPRRRRQATQATAEPLCSQRREALSDEKQHGWIFLTIEPLVLVSSPFSVASGLRMIRASPESVCSGTADSSRSSQQANCIDTHSPQVESSCDRPEIRLRVEGTDSANRRAVCG